MNIRIEKVDQLPFPGFSNLLTESLTEGYNFVQRLTHEWESGKNRFAQKSEGLYKISMKEQVVGIGGINRDPYSEPNYFGRLRRFYIMSAYRGQGIGGVLLKEILRRHENKFDAIVLRTDNEMAGLFYEKHGFVAVQGQPNYTHMKEKSTLYFQDD